MRALIILGIASLLLGCATKERQTYQQWKAQEDARAAARAAAAPALPRITTRNLIVSDQPFSSNGVVKEEEMRLSREIRLHKVEEGDLNGVRYRFYYAGSGKFAGKAGNTLSDRESTFDNWQTRCSKDAMDDKVRCMAFYNDLTVSVHGDGRAYILVGENHYPGSSIALRVGSSQAFEASSKTQFAPPQSEKIIAQLKSGASITTRYQEWPHKSYKDSTFQLYGFEEVYSYLQWAVKNIR